MNHCFDLHQRSTSIIHWLCPCIGTTYKPKLCNFNTSNLSDTISTEDIWYPKLTWRGPEAGKTKLNTTPPPWASHRKESCLASSSPSSEQPSRWALGITEQNFLLPHLFFSSAIMGDFLAHHPWNVICSDKRGVEKTRYTFSEWQPLHYSRNAKCIWQALETNTRRGLTSCFPCKSFQSTHAIWNVYLMSVA